MTTAATLVNDALTLLNVASAISPPDPDQQSTGFGVLKDLIESMHQDGIDLKVNTLDSITDELYEPESATMHLKRVLAEAMEPYFPGSTLSEKLQEKIKESWSALIIQTESTKKITNPNMPTGQGNRRKRWG